MPLQKNHLSGLKRKLLKLSFWNVQQLMEVRRGLQPMIAKNRTKARTTQVRTVFFVLYWCYCSAADGSAVWPAADDHGEQGQSTHHAGL